MSGQIDKTIFMQSFQALDYQGLKELLKDNPGQVDRAFYGRLRFLKSAAAFNSLTTPWDHIFYKNRIKKAVPPDPVFVLGHWRSGTTLLHNMLSRDPQFGFPTLTHVFTPNSFLTLGKITRAYLNRVLPEKRSMDQVVLGADEPQEDEFAVAVMCRLSPYLEMVFPRRRDHYSRYMTLDEVPENERQLWQKTFLTFLKKMSIADPRPMLLKSPPHTARVALLSRMFPSAKFIHIVRNPYRVYQSMWKLYDHYIAMQHLQVISREEARDNMLKNYHQMFTALERDKGQVEKNRFITIHYEDLVKDPPGQTGLIYKRLGMPGFSHMESRLAHYLESIRNYRPNRPESLEQEERDLVEYWCRPVFDAYGYSRGSAASA